MIAVNQKPFYGIYIYILTSVEDCHHHSQSMLIYSVEVSSSSMCRSVKIKDINVKQ